MKKMIVFLSLLVLTISAFTGCGCKNSRPAQVTEPTTMPTVMTTEPFTEMTTETATQPTTEPQTNATIQDGNGPIEDNVTTENTDAARNGSGITGSIIE